MKNGTNNASGHNAGSGNRPVSAHIEQQHIQSTDGMQCKESMHVAAASGGREQLGPQPATVNIRSKMRPIG